MSAYKQKLRKREVELKEKVDKVFHQHVANEIAVKLTEPDERVINVNNHVEQTFIKYGGFTLFEFLVMTKFVSMKLE